MSEIHQYKLRNGSSPAWYDEGTGPTPDAWHLDCVQPDHIWRTVYQQGHEAALSQPAGVAPDEIEEVATSLDDDAAAMLDENEEDERALNMQLAARILESWLAAAPAASGWNITDRSHEIDFDDGLDGPAASGGDGPSPSLKQIVPAEKRNYLDDNGNPHSIEDEAYSLGWNACRSATLKAIAKSEAYPHPQSGASVSERAEFSAGDAVFAFSAMLTSLPHVVPFGAAAWATPGVDLATAFNEANGLSVSINFPGGLKFPEITGLLLARVKKAAEQDDDALSSPRREGDSTAASTQGLQAEIDRLNAIINTPQSNDFLRAVSTEAEHQRQRWGSDHDSGKTPADWFWLVGYLAGKALHAHAASDLTKAEHHVITAAAALANWHMAMFGNTDMRPGIDGESLLTSPTTGADGDNT